jgi:hypothetical protein
MADWLKIRADPIEAVEHGVDAADDHFATTDTGPVSFDRIDYPFAQVYPESTQRADATNWRHRIVVNLFFERDRGLDYVSEVLRPTAAVIDATLVAMQATDCITNYHPTSVEDYAGELNNTGLLLVTITFECVTQVDPDFGA